MSAAFIWNCWSRLRRKVPLPDFWRTVARASITSLFELTTSPASSRRPPAPECPDPRKSRSRERRESSLLPASKIDSWSADRALRNQASLNPLASSRRVVKPPSCLTENLIHAHIQALLSTLEQNAAPPMLPAARRTCRTPQERPHDCARPHRRTFRREYLHGVGLHAQHDCHNFGMEGKSMPGDGVITGVGYVDGRPVAAFSQTSPSAAAPWGESTPRRCATSWITRRRPASR